MIVVLHKNSLKKIITHFTTKDNNRNNINNNEIPLREFDLVVDDSVRRNVTVTTYDM